MAASFCQKVKTFSNPVLTVSQPGCLLRVSFNHLIWGCLTCFFNCIYVCVCWVVILAHVLPCCTWLLTVWLDGSLWRAALFVLLPALTDSFFRCFSVSSNPFFPPVLLLLTVFASPPACFVHAVPCAQTRALLRNAGLASASTNKRTGAVPAGGYQTSTNSIILHTWHSRSPLLHSNHHATSASSPSDGFSVMQTILEGRVSLKGSSDPNLINFIRYYHFSFLLSLVLLPSSELWGALPSVNAWKSRSFACCLSLTFSSTHGHIIAMK